MLYTCLRWRIGSISKAEELFSCQVFPFSASVTVKRGDNLILRPPLLDTIETRLKEIEMINYRSKTEKKAAPILLPLDLHKFDIPIGTEVFLKNE